MIGSSEARERAMLAERLQTRRVVAGENFYAISPSERELIIVALSAPVPCAGEKEGWKLVPVEPTTEMVYAALRNQPDAINTGFAQAYRAMLAAAPSPPRQGVEREKIARIMEPMFDRLSEYNSDYPQHSKSAWLKKADLVLASLQPERHPK